MENNSHVPNHQPVYIYIYPIYCPNGNTQQWLSTQFLSIPWFLPAAQLLALAAQDIDQPLAEPAGSIFRALEEVLGTDQAVMVRWGDSADS